MKFKKYFLIIILVLASFFRLAYLDRGDPLTDEILYAFRSVGPLDFAAAQDQTTPLEWFDGHIPAWTKLSFHDHPPLVFWIQHVSMKIFGETNFAYRLPSALLGILSVYLLYLIGKKLFSQPLGLLAAGLLAINNNHIYVSRLGLQEAYVIFFILLTLYFFILAKDNHRYWWLMGVALGLGMLTKYTTFIVVPIILTYLLIFDRPAFKNRHFYQSFIISLVLFLPVLIYNLKLFQVTGHLDFQISYMLGKVPAVWSVAPGKDIGTLADRLSQFGPNMLGTYFYGFLLLSLASLIYLLFTIKQGVKAAKLLILISFFYLLILILKIGPSYRFLTMLSPFLVLIVAVALWDFYEKFLSNKKKLAIAILVLFMLGEFLYISNTYLVRYPYGRKIWLYSPTSFDTYNWGYHELGNYLDKELSDKTPAVVFNLKYNFLGDWQNKALDKDKAQGKALYPALIIYDDNTYNIPQMWYLERLSIYHAWPVIKAQSYKEFLDTQGQDFFVKAGIKYFYFIVASDQILLKEPAYRSEAAQNLLSNLAGKNISVRTIDNPKGQAAFEVYTWQE